METVAYVYKWIHIPTGKWYIGSRTRVGSHPDDGYYCSEITSGSTCKVTVERDGVIVSCSGILIWEEELMDDYLFDEWVDLARAGQVGYELAN